MSLGLGGICLTAISPSLWAQADPASAPPQVGDLLVKLDDPASKPLGPADVAANAPPLMAWPMDPVSKTVRKANRLNQVLLIRLNPGDTTPNAVDGVLAFSGLCSHAGCDVTDWMPDTGILSCDCHSSDFNAKASGAVVGGPAAHALPPLGLRIDGSVLVVDKPFAAPIHFDEA